MHEHDSLVRLRQDLDGLSEQPVAAHVPALTAALDAIVGELDDLARTIPPAR